MNGFKTAVKKCFRLSEEAFAGIKWADLLRFCAIHYTRSVHKVSKKSEVIPLNKKHKFIALALRLASRTISIEEFDNTAEEIIIHFPGIEPWLRWYQQSNKTNVAFPATCDGNRRSDHFSDNTNAQESLNRVFNLVAVTPPKSVGDVIAAIATFVEMYHLRYLAQTSLQATSPIRHHKAPASSRCPLKSNRHVTSHNPGANSELIYTLFRTAIFDSSKCRTSQHKIYNVEHSWYHREGSQQCIPCRSMGNAREMYGRPKLWICGRDDQHQNWGVIVKIHRILLAWSNVWWHNSCWYSQDGAWWSYKRRWAPWNDSADVYGWEIRGRQWCLWRRSKTFLLDLCQNQNDNKYKSVPVEIYIN